MLEYQKSLQTDLERILSQVAGAGRVSVNVTLDGGPSYLYGENETVTEKKTDEKDRNGGTRLIDEVSRVVQMVILHQGSGGDKPVVVQVKRPQVTGVLVVADGAADSRVRARLIEAVSTLLDLPTYRVVVVPRSTGGN